MSFELGFDVFGFGLDRREPREIVSDAGEKRKEEDATRRKEKTRLARPSKRLRSSSILLGFCESNL